MACNISERKQILKNLNRTLVVNLLKPMGKNLKGFPFKMTKQFYFKVGYVQCGACALVNLTTELC